MIDSKLEAMLNDIKVQCHECLADIEQSKKGNKSAMRRIRKFTLAMGNKIGKEFRKSSLCGPQRSELT